MDLFVGNISFDATDEQLKAHFQEIGDVEKAKIIHDKETQRSRGFGFVTMASQDAANLAIKHLHEQPFMGRNLTVRLAEKRQEYGGGGGRPQRSVREQRYDRRGGGRR